MGFSHNFVAKVRIKNKIAKDFCDFIFFRPDGGGETTDENYRRKPAGGAALLVPPEQVELALQGEAVADGLGVGLLDVG